MRGDERTDLFLDLTPDRVLQAVDAGGLTTNPVCYPLNSYENRVYEVELHDRSRVVAKFYRPGRWTEAQILEEHDYMQALVDAEVPICPLLRFPNGDTLRRTDEGIWYCLYPRFGGRAPEELTPELAVRLGRLVGRLQNEGAQLDPPAKERRRLDAETFGWDSIDVLEQSGLVPPELAGPYFDAAASLVELAEERLADAAFSLVHGDFHMGNLLLRQGEQPGDTIIHALDFDDCALAPAVQDLWLVLPGRGEHAEQLLEHLLKGYSEFREFDRTTLHLIEPLRGLRMIHYAAWLARRWHDPIFPRTWPQFTTQQWWRSELDGLKECVVEAVAALGTDGAGELAHDPEAPPDEPELTNADFFFDWEG